MRRLMLIFAGCLVAGAPGWSADFPRSEVFGSVGWARRWDDLGAPINGLVAGGGVGRRLLPQFTVEFETLGFFGTRGTPAFGPSDRVRGLQFSANGKLYVYRSSRTRVFILLGAGGAYSTNTVDFDGFHLQASHTGFVANAGAGLEIFLNRSVALRPEIRMLGGSLGTASGNPFAAELRATLGIGYHW